MVLRKLYPFLVFAIAMAYLEAAVVVYLREIYYPDGFQFPLKLIADRMAIIEIGREAATIIMLWFITLMASNKFKEQFPLFLFAFGVWDIFYYFWLKVLINWPALRGEWDILFLIPVPWVAPWLYPVLVSIGFIVAAVLTLHHSAKFSDTILTTKEWILMILAAVIILFSFLWETEKVLAGLIPVYFPWWLFLIGYGLGLVVFIRRLILKRS